MPTILSTPPATTTTRFELSPGRTAATLALLCLQLYATGAAADEAPAASGAAAASTPANRGDAAAIYAELAPQEAERAGDPAFDRRFGVAALDSGHLTRAIFALERLVSARPDDRPARAELARAYLAAGEIESGRRELAQARRGDMPADAAAAMDRVLGVLDDVAPKDGPRLAAYLELGGGWDTNVNSATNAGQLAVPAFGGLLFTVAPGNGQRHDAFGSLAGGASLQWRLDDRWRLLAGTNLRTVQNRHAHDVDTTLLDLSVGASHEAGPDLQTVALQADRAWLDTRTYRTTAGASAQWQRQLGASSQASLFGQWARQEYTGQRERDTDRSVLGLAGAHSIERTGTLAYGSAYLAVERAREAGFDYHGHHATGWRFGAEQHFVRAQAWTAYAEWQHERRRYGGVEPLFQTGRRDTQDDVIAGVRWSPAPGWQLASQLHHTNAPSTVALYDYTRTIAEIRLRKDFD